MMTEGHIRTRFIKCLDEVLVNRQQMDVAKAIGTSPVYLSQLRTKPNPSIPSAVIARFCHLYRYSPTYILIGKGDKRTGPDPEDTKDIIYLRLIETLVRQKGKISDNLMSEVRKLAINLK